MRSRQPITLANTTDSVRELRAADASGTHAIASRRPGQLEVALRERDHLRTERDHLCAERDYLCAERDHLRAERDGLADRLKAAVEELALLKSSLEDEPSTLPPLATPAPSLSPASDSEEWPVSDSLSRIVVSARPPADASFAVPPDSDFDLDRPGSAERRQRGRLGCEFEVEFLHDTYLIAGLTQDISEGGVFVATYRTLPLGTQVTLALELPVGRVEVRGEVRWVRPELEESEQRPGLGVAFTELTAEALAALRQLCLLQPAHYHDM